MRKIAKMRHYFCITIGLLFGVGFVLGLCGCDWLKGEKGDRGSPAVISSKVYTGTPTTNIYQIHCPEITGNNNQAISVFMVLPTNTKVGLPFSDTIQLHYYMVTGTIVGLSTLGLNGHASPTRALYDGAWGQCSYRIEIRTFATAQAKQAYLKMDAPAKSQYDTLIYGAN
jgi:hypothetical protein